MSLADFMLRIIADGLVVPIVIIGIAAALRVKNDRYQVYARAVMVGLVALFFAGVLRLFVADGARPFELIGAQAGAAYIDNPGFPSDHALLVFTVTGVVWAITKNRVLGGVLLALSILVVVGRVAALVHTPADVLAGAICAIVAAALIYGRTFFSLDTTK